jgi:hypothetical protein
MLLIKRGRGTGPMKPGNLHFCKVLIPEVCNAEDEISGLLFEESFFLKGRIK